MLEGRVATLKEGLPGRGPVVYWMSRDQRADDNWALLFAARLALDAKVPLVVLFCLVPAFLGATARHYGFMLRGLKELEGALEDKGIPFVLVEGEPAEEVSSFVEKAGAAALVADFDPLRIKREWKAKAASRVNSPFYEVDAHNIVPCRIASTKLEYAARTFRPRIGLRLPAFLTSFPRLGKHPHKARIRAGFDLERVLKNLEADRTVPEVDWIRPGAAAAEKALFAFIRGKLSRYHEDRNDPMADGQSGLSPYLHFGQLSAQRVALEVEKSRAPDTAKKAFLEELIVRRELSDNFCFYNLRYDSVEGFPAWAKRTLFERARDKREFVYSVKEFEGALTHDELWNAAQRQMVKTGKMHGFMRMYWAKKILEWSEDAGAALRTAIYLNDRYELDGRDPNGYAGVAWSIGGVHDRAWQERKVTGKIRYMSYRGCRSKFDVDAYVGRWG